MGGTVQPWLEYCAAKLPGTVRFESTMPEIWAAFAFANARFRLAGMATVRRVELDNYAVATVDRSLS